MVLLHFRCQDVGKIDGRVHNQACKESLASSSLCKRISKAVLLTWQSIMAAVNHTLIYAFFVIFGVGFFFKVVPFLFLSKAACRCFVCVHSSCRRSRWAVLSPHNCWVTCNYARMCNPDLYSSLSQFYMHRGFNLLWLLIHFIALALSQETVMCRYFGAESLGFLPEENAPRRAVIFTPSPFRRGKKILH